MREDETLGLSGLRFGVIEPVAGTRPTEARRARLLAVLSLLQAGMTCVGAVESLLFQPADMGRVIAIVLAPTTLGYLVVFALARRGRVEAAAVLTLVLQCAVPTAVRLALRDLDLHAMSSAAWLSIAVLTANATLDTRGVLVAGAATSTCFAGALYVSRGTSAELGEGLLFLATTTAATYAYSLHRDGVEATRQAQLRSRNEELETLRSTLEARVRARTEELGRKAHELSRSYAALEASQAVLLRTEKMAAVGRLTAGFAHELATPLSATLATLDEVDSLRAEYVESIGDASVGDDDHREIASDMGKALAIGKNAVARAIRFVRGMRAHTRDGGRCAAERFDAREIANEAVELLAYQARAARVDLALVAGEQAMHVSAVPARLSQALTNLVQNAVDAVAETGRPGRVSVVLARCGDRVRFRVEDDGPGIADDVLPHVFEPMFTTKPHGKGTGLGLAIVHEIVCDELGGEVRIESARGVGSTFVIDIPLDSKGDADGTQAT